MERGLQLEHSQMLREGRKGRGSHRCLVPKEGSNVAELSSSFDGVYINNCVYEQWKTEGGRDREIPLLRGFFDFTVIRKA